MYFKVKVGFNSFILMQLLKCTMKFYCCGYFTVQCLRTMNK